MATLISEPTERVYSFHRGLLAQPNCEGCPLRGEKIVPPEGNPNALVAIVGESPGFNEVQEGRPFVGQSGHFLQYLFERAGAVREQFWITNSILCKPKQVEYQDHPVSADQVVKLAGNFCRSRLFAELQIVKPKSVVGLGNQALRSMLSPKYTLGGRRGGIHIVDLLKPES